ncbi:MAG: outer membrane protein assembly factor BamA [Brevinemataceae bacterium]
MNGEALLKLSSVVWKSLSLILFFTVSILFSQDQSLIISDIKFEGLKSTSANDILNVIQIKPGELFSSDKLNFAIKDIFNMSRFQSVKVRTERSAGGVVVTFIVEEEALIDRIIFEGVSGFKANKLKEQLDFKEGTAFREARVRAALFNIREYYRKEGNLEAQVTYRLDPIKQLPGQYDLVFEVSEGSKIVVQDIIFTGTQAIKSKKLLSIMQTKKKVWIFRSGVLKDVEFLQDKERILAFYQQNGYIDAEVTNFSWDIEDISTTNKEGQIVKTTKGIVIRIGIDEGNLYTTGDFTIEGNTIFSTAELRKLIHLQKLDVYDRSKIEQIRANIFKMYADRGYLFANISAVQEKRENNVIDTIFVIFEGGQAHIENITVRGNTKTLPSVIRRYIQFQEGELYVNRKLEQTFNRLMQTQFFSDVRLDPSAGSLPGLVNIDVSVTETQTGMIEFLVGFGTVSGFSGGIKLSEKNLAGRGLQLAVRGEYGEFRQLGEITFTEPAIFNSPFSISFVAGVFNTIFIDIPVDENRDGFIDGTDFDWETNSDQVLNRFESPYRYTRLSFRFGLAVGLQFAVYWNASVGYEINIFKDYQANFNNPLKFDGRWQVDNTLIDSLAFGWTVQSSVYTTLRFNNTDGGLWPTRGINTALFLSFSGGALGGDIDFVNMTYVFDFYWNPFWLLTVAFHYDMGFLFPQIGHKFSYRDANLMNFDGVYKMRGWIRYLSKGEAMSYFSIETRIPIWSFIGAVAFWDYGAIFANYRDFTFNQAPYIMSFGLGLALNLPVLPIRLYVARPVEWNFATGSFELANTPDFWKGWEFVFSIQGLF